MVGKIIQLAAAYDHGESCAAGVPTYQPAIQLFALTDEGEIWSHYLGAWTWIPGPDDDPYPKP